MKENEREYEETCQLFDFSAEREEGSGRFDSDNDPVFVRVNLEDLFSKEEQ